MIMPLMYERWLTEKGLAESSVRSYLSTTRAFWRRCNRVESLGDIEGEAVKYLHRLRDHQYMGSTIERNYVTLASFLSFLGLENPERLRVARKEVIQCVDNTRYKKAPFAREHIEQLIDSIDTCSMIGKRDRALVLVGFWGAFRTSELASIRCGDVSFAKKGEMLVRFRREKTSEDAALRFLKQGDKLCPVEAVANWMLSGICQKSYFNCKQGHLFRSIHRSGSVQSRQLQAGSIRIIIKRLAEGIGLNAVQFSGNSLRRGGAQECVSEEDLHTLKGVLGHMDVVTYCLNKDVA